MKTEILITGATGTTGQYAIRHLLEKGIKLRAMVRTIDERSKALESLGVEVVQGDFMDIQSLNKAMKGIKRAYFLYPFIDHLPKAAAYFAHAAKNNRLEMIVAMSQMGVTENSPSPATQNHSIAERILDWADVGAVHIRPALFAWNYLGFAAPTVSDHQKFYYPLADARYSIVHPKDVGEVVAEILTDSDYSHHIGKRYDLTGPTVHSAQQVAKDISETIGKQVDYVPIPVETWIENIKSHPTVNEFLAKHLKEFSSEVGDGRFDRTSDAVHTITGHEARTFKTYLEEYKELFV
ncbi:NmrA family NAD(P)-binding protein [Flagellimonas sp. S3867]|uniref:NmrA family NAD(P)-binding protein n=1 Tax=Flagellimonas sp. S3867 TaxID=2768063 RepID=UPI001685A96E|nr:NmrA family NAD(P)-binding protein [Flagellimonas sp. S3867]